MDELEIPRTSGWPKVASSEAIVISEHNAYQNPPPRHHPLTAAITGVESSMTCMKPSTLL